MLKKLIITLFFLFISTLSASEGPWNGVWHVFSESVTLLLKLEQHGSDVNGSFEPSHGTLTGKVDHNILNAVTVTENNASSQFSFTISESQKAFFGTNALGVWVAGVRVKADSEFNALKINLSSPMNSLYSFLALGNSARAGNYEVLEKAIGILHFTEEQKGLLHGSRMILIQTFFNILDECLVDKLAFFKSANTQKKSILLRQVGSDVSIRIDFIQEKHTKLWKIKLPESAILDRQMKALLAARGKYEIDPKANLELQHARATMRTLFEQYDRWESGGKKFVISTMNFSEIDPAIHEWQAPMLAYYLKNVLDRISYVIYQEVPNDPKSKKPYIHFHHPIGNIIIAPYEIDRKIKWQFTPQTLATIDALYYEMEHVKNKYPTMELEENNLYFGLKKFAKEISPLLLQKFYYTEFWQILMLVLILFFAVMVSFSVKYAVFYVFKRFYFTKRWTEEMISLRYLKPFRITTLGIILLYGAHQLGLSNFLFSIIKTFTHLIIVIGITWIIYNLISLMFSVLQIRAKKTSTNVDEIILSLAGSILRILLITAALFIIAEIFNIPYQTVVAGLGIGGLAFAIAAKDTIANFFGSAIIIADRPFKIGDLVKIGSDIGRITDVGIRSTKIRTTFDTVLSVPNNMITHEMIDNYSEREAMRFDTEFFFDLDTSKETLDSLDSAIADYLANSDRINQNKTLLTGTNDYTKYGISYGLTFFVKATTLEEYSEYRHILITEIAQIIKDHQIKLISIRHEYLEDKEK